MPLSNHLHSIKKVEPKKPKNPVVNMLAPGTFACSDFLDMMWSTYTFDTTKLQTIDQVLEKILEQMERLYKVNRRIDHTTIAISGFLPITVTTIFLTLDSTNAAVGHAYTANHEYDIEMERWLHEVGKANGTFLPKPYLKYADTSTSIWINHADKIIGYALALLTASLGFYLKGLLSVRDEGLHALGVLLNKLSEFELEQDAAKRLYKACYQQIFKQNANNDNRGQVSFMRRAWNKLADLIESLRNHNDAEAAYQNVDQASHAEHVASDEETATATQDPQQSQQVPMSVLTQLLAAVQSLHDTLRPDHNEEESEEDEEDVESQRESNNEDNEHEADQSASREPKPDHHGMVIHEVEDEEPSHNAGSNVQATTSSTSTTSTSSGLPLSKDHSSVARLFAAKTGKTAKAETSRGQVKPKNDPGLFGGSGSKRRRQQKRNTGGPSPVVHI